MAYQDDPQAAVLDAARRLYGEDPEFTMARLATAAGVSRATLYRLVGSREALLRQLVADGAAEQAVPTRERILDAANEVLGARGFDGATVEEIAGRAGVSAMTVYRHFEGREGLVRALMQERGSRELAREIALGDGADLEDDLLALAEGVLRTVSRNAGLIQMVFGTSRSRWEELAPLRDAQRGTAAAIERYLQARVDEGRLGGADGRTLARAFLGMLMTFSYFEPEYLEQTRRDHEQTARFVVRMFLDGARGEG